MGELISHAGIILVRDVLSHLADDAGNEHVDHAAAAADEDVPREFAEAVAAAAAAAAVAAESMEPVVPATESAERYSRTDEDRISSRPLPPSTPPPAAAATVPAEADSIAPDSSHAAAEDTPSAAEQIASEAPRLLSSLAAAVRRPGAGVILARMLSAVAGLNGGLVREILYGIRNDAEGYRRALLSTMRNINLMSDMTHVFEAVGKHERPVLVVWGTADTVLPFGCSHALSRAMPRARRLTVPGAGHGPHACLFAGPRVAREALRFVLEATDTPLPPSLPPSPQGSPFSPPASPSRLPQAFAALGVAPSLSAALRDTDGDSMGSGWSTDSSGSDGVVEAETRSGLATLLQSRIGPGHVTDAVGWVSGVLAGRSRAVLAVTSVVAALVTLGVAV
jgi:pimeloyl-ACP methyl ester carboxylesterase